MNIQKKIKSKHKKNILIFCLHLYFFMIVVRNVVCLIFLYILISFVKIKKKKSKIEVKIYKKNLKCIFAPPNPVESRNINSSDGPFFVKEHIHLVCLLYVKKNICM